MARRTVNPGHVVQGENAEKSAAELLLEEKGGEFALGAEEDSEHDASSSDEELHDPDGETADKPDVGAENDPDGETEPQDSSICRVILKRAASFWGRGKKYQQGKTYSVSPEEGKYLMATKLFEEVK